MPAHFLATLPNFLAYLGAAAVLLAAFVAIYLFVTPYDEIKLIRENNIAAAVSLSGAVLGGSVAAEWWFWTLIAVVVAGGVVAGVVVGTQPGVPEGTLGTVTLMRP